MNRISITVDHTNHAIMLAEWLKNIRFVQEVNIKLDELSYGNAQEVKKILNSIKSKQILANVTDPVAYQKTIRNEWR